MLESGVDAAGTVILKYADFHVNVMHSKVSASINSSEIQGEKGTLVIGNIYIISGLEFVDKSGHVTEILVQQDASTLLYVAQHLGKCISSGLKESPVNTHVISTKVMSIHDEVRLQTGVRYPADNG